MTVPQLLHKAEKFAASHRAYAKELAPAYADFHNSIASLLERLAAALTESQRELDNVLAVSGMDALLSERDALRAQREALREALRPFAAAAENPALVLGEAWYRARAVLAQGEELPH